MIRARPINFRPGSIEHILAGRVTQERRFRSSTFDASAIGDLLWVREPFRFDREYDGVSPRNVYARDLKPRIRYVADEGGATDGEGQLRYARTLPRRASRLILQVAAVRQGALQDWTEADYRALFLSKLEYAREWDAFRTAARQFDPNGCRAAWGDNLTVTIVDFVPIRANIDRHLKKLRSGQGKAPAGPSEPAGGLKPPLARTVPGNSPARSPETVLPAPEN